MLATIQRAGFREPRPIQRQTIPAALADRDVLGLAQTGTGKTAAFALPLIQRLSRQAGGKRRHGSKPAALILAPTRELAQQIHEDIQMLAASTGVRSVTIFGGVNQIHQVRALARGPQIVVGCPGRVLDLSQQRHLDLRFVETLVLDEADHLFDMGFLPTVRKIVEVVPAERQTLFFSATMPKAVRHLADDMLSNPHVVELANSRPAETIDHGLFIVRDDEKRDLLEQLLSHRDFRSAIVFTRTKHRARRLAKQLAAAGHRAVGLQGNMSQPQRDRAMRGFKGETYDVLVATDIAARGIDVSGVSHVVNFDAPDTAEAYTHRIGRTGRAERTGIARTFVTAKDHDWIRATERMMGQRIPRHDVDSVSA